MRCGVPVDRNSASAGGRVDGGEADFGPKCFIRLGASSFDANSIGLSDGDFQTDGIVSRGLALDFRQTGERWRKRHMQMSTLLALFEKDFDRPFDHLPAMLITNSFQTNIARHLL